MVVVVKTLPLRSAVQVYSPTSDGAIWLSVSLLDTIRPMEYGGTELSIYPLGPYHQKDGVPVTPVGRVREQVRVTQSPTVGEE